MGTCDGWTRQSCRTGDRRAAARLLSLRARGHARDLIPRPSLPLPSEILMRTRGPSSHRRSQPFRPGWLRKDRQSDRRRRHPRRCRVILHIDAPMFALAVVVLAGTNWPARAGQGSQERLITNADAANATDDASASLDSTRSTDSSSAATSNYTDHISISLAGVDQLGQPISLGPQAWCLSSHRRRRRKPGSLLTRLSSPTIL
jgi:hypothetical protein